MSNLRTSATTILTQYTDEAFKAQVHDYLDYIIKCGPDGEDNCTPEEMRAYIHAILDPKNQPRDVELVIVRAMVNCI